MKDHDNAEPLALTAWLLAAFPIAFLVLFFTYVLRARLHLGYWPSYNHPDPKQLGWRVQHGLLWLGLLNFPYAAGLAVVLAIIGRVRTRDFPVWAIICTAVLGSAAVIVLGRMDPGGFMDWFCD
jgi:hypothetical protein